MLGGLDGEEGISAVTNAAGMEEFKRKNKQLFLCIFPFLGETDARNQHF